MTYRRRYLAQAQLPSVLDLLVGDKGNPRSLAFQLMALEEHAANLPHYEDAVNAHPEMRRLRNLAKHLEQADLVELSRRCGENECAPLDKWLNDFVIGFGALSDELTHHYFSLTVARVS
jgi:uncharacterized alpha-E superfamily protein